MAEAPPDWNATLERLLSGDPVAFARFNRLLTGFLVQLRAYDFRDDWDDLRQEVLLAVLRNWRAERLRDPQALVGYVRIITRNKYVDRLKREIRHPEARALPWDDECARALAAPASAPDEVAGRSQVWEAVAELPEEERSIIEGLYRRGKTYPELSRDSGVPLGTLKRRLRHALETLRSRLGEAPALPDPVRADRATSSPGEGSR